MDKKQETILSQRVESMLSMNNPIDEELFGRLFSMLAESLRDQPSSGSPSLLDLEEDVAARYAYDNASEMEGFATGACWGALELYRECLATYQRAQGARQWAQLIRKHYDLFSIINKEPGISQGTLASYLHETKSNFSQKLARLEKYQLFVSSLVGRTKHLYLTQRGAEALAAVEYEMAVGSVSADEDVRLVHAETNAAPYRPAPFDIEYEGLTCDREQDGIHDMVAANGYRLAAASNSNSSRRAGMAKLPLGSTAANMHAHTCTNLQLYQQPSRPNKVA